MKSPPFKSKSLELLFPGVTIFLIFIIPFISFSAEPSKKESMREEQNNSPYASIAISISFDTGKKVMEGRSTITFPARGEKLIHVGSLKIKSLRYNGNSIEPAVKDSVITIKAEKKGILTIEYECDSGQDPSCVIDDKGISLSGSWHPSVEGLAYYDFRALVPDHLVAISEAEAIETEKEPRGNLFSFRFPHPVDGINFIAGRFGVKKEKFRDIDLYAYFFPEDRGLADEYLKYTKKYLEFYENMVGKYPYKRFSVVENFLPTGFSMPTFTLLGQDVVRLPFIVRTSLGHEILHQWLGNLVYVDYEKGNWVEGLTTYLADHLYEEQEGRGWQYRKQILIDYESYVLPENEFPLKDFRSRTDFASRAIGYGKSAMVFHMLKKLIGDDAFSMSIKKLVEGNKFKRVSWDDLKVIFEKESGKELNSFFDLWLNEKGFPSIEIKNTEIEPKGLQSLVSFDVIQKEKMYVFDIPASVKTDKGETTRILSINDKKQSFEVLTDGNPGKLVLDENYDAFRKISMDETPPVIGKLLGDEKGILVLAAQGTESAYSGLVDFFKGKGYAIKKTAEVKDEDIRGYHLLILGNENQLVKRLFGRVDIPSAGFALMVKKNPFNSEKVIGIASSSSKGETDASVRKISHYGKYSMVAFKEGRNIEKRIDDSKRGWSMPLRETILGIETTKAIKLSDITDRVSDKRIVYVGEQHDRYEHHLAQFEIIKDIFKRNPVKIAIGMEMFQRPFQKALDDYIEGKIDEKDFLKASEYFKRWSFDYNLYKDILRFARDERIPVIALNIRREIVDKISKNGIDSLTEEEKKELPESMDMTDETYREKLKEVFEQHEGSGEKKFENFYQSQIIWDEAMAQSVDEYLRKNPERIMVVIAGGGHLAFGSGIPKRVFRRNGLDHAIILNGESIDFAIADFILFPESATTASSPKLMTILKEEDGMVKIIGFPENSVSEKVGLKRDDIIVAIDDEGMKGIDDVKIFLFYKKAGDTVRVTILRKRFLFGDKELVFDIKLPGNLRKP